MTEVNAWEAVFNNIIGTQTILSLCLTNGVERCVIVSTDKAVRPTNVMGASKRVDEIMVQLYTRKYKRRFMAVRFGNVVGCAGSVVPLFQKQIQTGGPLTVTYPEAMRYFMTIPEASSLILQAGAMGEGGEVFILKMGTPIRIAEMARDIISLSGLKPGEEIEISYIGLRPGEKLQEELITEREDTGVAKPESDSTTPSPLAKKILSIRPETGEHGFKVHIIANGKLKDYNAFRIERPHRLVIDLPGVQCSLGQKALLVDSLLVKKIQVHTPNKDKVRIVFDLFPIAELPYRVFSKDNQLIVAFGSVAGFSVAGHAEKVQEVPPAGTSGKKEEAGGEYVQKTALTPARRITAVEIERGGQGTKVHIVADGKLTRYDSFHLFDPARLVVDLFGVQSAMGKETMLFSNPLVKGVRLGTSYKDQVWVVFDLVPPGGLPYQIVLKGNRLVVFVEQTSDISTTVPAGKLQSTFPYSSAEQAGATSVPVLPAGGKPFATVPPGKTILPISSFEEKNNAEDGLQRLGKHGYKAFLAPEQVLGESGLRVYIGDFKGEQEARKVGSELKRKGIISYFKPGTI